MTPLWGEIALPKVNVREEARDTKVGSSSFPLASDFLFDEYSPASTYLVSLCFLRYLVAQLPQGRLPSHLVLRERQRSQLAQSAMLLVECARLAWDSNCIVPPKSFMLVVGYGRRCSRSETSYSVVVVCSRPAITEDSGLFTRMDDRGQSIWGRFLGGSFGFHGFVPPRSPNQLPTRDNGQKKSFSVILRIK